MGISGSRRPLNFWAALPVQVCMETLHFTDLTAKETLKSDEQVDGWTFAAWCNATGFLASTLTEQGLKPFLRDWRAGVNPASYKY